MFQEGQQIGQYTLIRKLGKGGFGEVWLAEKRSQFVTKRVAVKLPLDEQVNFEAIRQEATLWEQASGHANVLPIIDADVYDGQVVIVSEYADGGSLHDKLKTEGKLPIKQAVEMTIGILNGLEFLHNKRIIHRDIKPQNILLQGETPRLADFGISRAMQTTAISSTIIGTDAYMSPEAFDGKRSIQSDIWAVGVVLYQLLTGNLPFPQEHPTERMYAILLREFEPLSEEIPQNLQNIITKSLAKLPENRYQTATEMREDLHRVLRSEIVSDFAQPDSLQTFSAEQIPPTQKVAPFFAQLSEDKKETVVRSAPNFARYEEHKTSNGWMYAMIALMLVGAIGFASYFLMYQSKQSDLSKNEVAQSNEIKTANSPTEAYKMLFAAVKSKNTEKIKQMMSENSLTFAGFIANQQKKTVEEVVVNGFTATTFSETLPQMRDERIKDNFGALEVMNPQTKQWEDLPFIREESGWKLAIGDMFKGTYEKPGIGQAIREQEASNTGNKK